jgi:NAD-dependent deacetylase
MTQWCGIINLLHDARSGGGGVGFHAQFVVKNMGGKMTRDIATLLSLIKEAQYCVAFTGAGVSTLSGIPDFRGENGIYKRNNPELNQLFDIISFLEDPSKFYRYAKDFLYGFADKQPSIVHTTLAKMEALGLLKAIITQNVDMLHQKAGSKKVYEVHGTATVTICRHCKDVRVPFDEAKAIVMRGEMPRCPKCGRVLKPAVTFFGEALPEEVVQKALEEAEQADLMLVLGTSLNVAPASGFPNVTLRNGGKIVIVNNQPTMIDDWAVLRFDDLNTVFTALNKALEF